MDDNFFKIIDKRNTREDGSVIDPKLRQRLQHPTCVACMEAYEKKFPGKPFKIVCEGIYTDDDYQEIADQQGTTLHAVKEVMDKVYWAKNHYKVPDEDGNLKPFICHDYQVEQMSCTAERKIDRWARGLGKTSCAEITEIHTAINRQNYPIMVLCPAKHQAKKWFDELVAIFENDTELQPTLLSKSQAPFYLLRISNGSTISIFTAGSKSGRSADSVRSVSPRRIRLEEQDLLNDKDYAAVSPLLRRYKDVQFGGSSTPLGKRETFWEMCTKREDYREFYYPIQRHPDFSPEYEAQCRQESRTEIRYTHEFLAEFGDQEAGVFKGVFVDIARENYQYSLQHHDSELRYWLGVDWNGKGTGTRLRVISYNPMTQMRRVVDHQAVDISHEASIDAIFEMNRKWHCEGVVTDAGHGGMENEVIKKRASLSSNLDDRRLMNVMVIDFGAELETNKLIPNRHGLRVEEEELKRRTKPFMVEGAVMALENELLQFSDSDSLIDEQLRAYHVKTWSQHGWANTYDGGTVGDHDLDALMLAMLGVEMKYGLLYQPKPRPLTGSSLSMLSGFGQQSVEMSLANTTGVADKRAVEKVAAGVPSRQVSQLSKIAANAGRLAAMQRGSAFIIPGQQTGRSAAGNVVPSRTAFFRGRGIPGYGRNNDAGRVRRTPLY